jgi:plasmid stabilization system protein ParE
MASPEPALTTRISPTATAELADIWHWNAERYGPDHADRYTEFLRSAIRQLPARHKRALPVPGNAEFRYSVIRRGSKGHGHIAVFRVRKQLIEVLHVFHTAQDWHAKIVEREPGG